MYLYIFISLILEGITSLITNTNGPLVPAFTVIAIIVSYSYMKDEKIKYVIVSSLTGLLYDLIYTQTLFLNTIVFTLIALLIIVFFKYIASNFVSVIINTILVIIFYRLIVFVILSITNNISFNMILLLKSILRTIIINYIYLFISYKIIDFISIRLGNKRGKYQMHTNVRKKY